MEINLTKEQKEYFYLKYSETLFFYFLKFLSYMEFKRKTKFLPIQKDRVIKILNVLVSDIKWDEIVNYFDERYSVEFEITPNERAFFVILTDLPWNFKEMIYTKPFTKQLMTQDCFKFNPKPLVFPNKELYKSICLAMMYLCDAFTFPLNFFNKVYMEIFNGQ